MAVEQVGQTGSIAEVAVVAEVAFGFALHSAWDSVAVAGGDPSPACEAGSGASWDHELPGALLLLPEFSCPKRTGCLACPFVVLADGLVVAIDFAEVPLGSKSFVDSLAVRSVGHQYSNQGWSVVACFLYLFLPLGTLC